MKVLFIIHTDEAVNFVPAPKKGELKAKVREWVVEYLNSSIDVVYDKGGEVVSVETIANAVMSYPKNENGFTFYVVEDGVFCITQHQDICTILDGVMEANGWTSFQHE